MDNVLCRLIVADFLDCSWESIKTLVDAVSKSRERERRAVSMFKLEGDKRVDLVFEGHRFFLRGSVEYSNPQVTLEEMQGIIGIKLLEACGNHFYNNGLHEPNADDNAAICELLEKPAKGPVVGFLLNTDDVEPDRYSMNPLKTSIVESGQSSYPAGKVTTQGLSVDEEFVKKYSGTLISRGETELIKTQLQNAGESYLDFVDAIKYAQLAAFSRVFCVDLCLPSMRMPISTLQSENKEGLLHQIISITHQDFSSVEQAYQCMGRSMKKRKTLLTVPHSSLGFGSKRAARGKLYFEEQKLKSVSVRYKDTLLYPNDVDPTDVSVAKGEDSFEVDAKLLSDYSFVETPSSPQFFLYSLGSPEDGTLWHGVGKYAAPKLLQSYSNARGACRRDQLFAGLPEQFGVGVEVPLQFNLVPESMWVHPKHGNIDASVGTIEDPVGLLRLGMKIEHLARFS
ncbi:MAG: hypothetical protein NWF04_05275 [Candidatus Bathyarchaeota archaeon]|nr:hypothetical protein [Candidatus Bathyarchaeota archaeon]